MLAYVLAILTGIVGFVLIMAVIGFIVDNISNNPPDPMTEEEFKKEMEILVSHLTADEFEYFEKNFDIEKSFRNYDHYDFLDVYREILEEAQKIVWVDYPESKERESRETNSAIQWQSSLDQAVQDFKARKNNGLR